MPGSRPAIRCSRRASRRRSRGSTREMRQPGGAFAASLDADSEGHEGKFYVWTRAEVVDVLGAEEGAFFADVYDIADGGNFEGVSIPNRLAASARCRAATKRDWPPRARSCWRGASTRVRPATDDKILADWNGLMIAALAFAGASFGAAEWIAMAADAFRFVTDDDERRRPARPFLARRQVGLSRPRHRLRRDDQGGAGAPRRDAGAAPIWRRPRRSPRTLRAHHWDAAAPGYFLSADDAEALIMRPKSTTDEATPGATSLMAQNLVRLWRLTGNDDYRRDVDDILAASGAAVAQNLFAIDRPPQRARSPARRRRCGDRDAAGRPGRRSSRGGPRALDAEHDPVGPRGRGAPAGRSSRRRARRRWRAGRRPMSAAARRARCR